MAAEEDKKFDAVLGGFLINDLRIRAGDLHCPASDTLAAYHERSLLPEEMNSWKEHVAGCARCQAILAELEASDAVPLQVSENEELLPAAAAPAAGAAKPFPPSPEATATLPAKSRGVRWQWLAPAGALAAGLLVWVAWHENRALQLKTPAQVRTASLETPGTPPAVARDDQQVSAREVSPISKDQSAEGAAAPKKPAPEVKSLKQFEIPASRARVARSEPPADKKTGTRAATGLDSLAAANPAQNQAAQDGKARASGAVSQTVEVQALTANAQQQNQQAQQNLQAQISEQKASGPNPSKNEEKTGKRKAKSLAPAYGAAATPAAEAPPPAPAPVAAFNDSTVLRMAAAMRPFVIAAPGGKSLWRAGQSGMIEYSSDSGASWLRQTSKVLADLTAGSAPSDTVCWIVGRAGTILLTTDAGASWGLIHAPLAEDWGGVRATDALHATLWNLGNTKIFETSDGGATWKAAISR
jgi:hypothetical protein